MSIFTHTFPRYVRKQLEDRESILAIGNNLSENRFSKNKYPAGAFYTNTVEKQCVARMSSGVNVIDQKFLFPLVSEEADPSMIARDWILEGGVFTKDKVQGKIHKGLESYDEYTINEGDGAQ